METPHLVGDQMNKTVSNIPLKLCYHYGSLPFTLNQRFTLSFLLSTLPFAVPLFAPSLNWAMFWVELLDITEARTAYQSHVRKENRIQALQRWPWPSTKYIKGEMGGCPSVHEKSKDMLIGIMSKRHRKRRPVQPMWLCSATHQLTHTSTDFFCCLNCSDRAEHKAEIGHLGQQTQASEFCRNRVGCWNSFNCWKTMVELSLFTPGKEITLHPPTCHLFHLKTQFGRWQQVSFGIWEASVCNQAGWKGGGHLPLPNTCHIMCSIGTALPLTGETISVCPPCLICRGLSWQGLHQNDARNLKALPLCFSLFALNCSLWGFFFFGGGSSIFCCVWTIQT